MCAQRSYKQHIYKIYLSNTYLKSSKYIDVMKEKNMYKKKQTALLNDPIHSTI